MPIKLVIKANEFWDFNKEEFINTEDTIIHIEHSLAAIAKWEGRWKKSFFSNTALTGDELLDYIRCMTIEEDIPSYVYMSLSQENLETIKSYLEDPMTAAWFKEQPKSGKSVGSTLTAEIIYYYMVELGIPFECENWHFNRLMTLIRVCSEKQAVPKKMAKKDIFSQNAALNAQRKARLKTRG